MNKSMNLATGLITSNVGNTPNNMVRNAAGELVPVYRGGPITFDAGDFGKTLQNGVIDPSKAAQPKGISLNTDPDAAA